MKPILITCYVNPDLDGYASLVAYAELFDKKGGNVIAGIIGQPHDEVEYVLDRFGLDKVDEISDDELFNEVILVDASDVNCLKGKINPEKVIEIIDHRKIHEADKFINAKAQIELVGAAATLIAEKFKLENITISQKSAILLYSAIISNTLNFKGSITTIRDMDMAKWLRQFINVSNDYWIDLFTAKSDLSGSKLAKTIEGDSAWFTIAGKKITIAQLEIIGVKDLIEKRLPEIISALKKLKGNNELEIVFLNAIDLKLGNNTIVATDAGTKKLLEKSLGVKFVGDVAKKKSVIMRKQIIPLIKMELENNL
ncbi:MAG: putative manganese-dependent inorganic pyrophosphatase [Parcubacteria group bacterium GW2011_GWE2_38_18]|nr:MAG: putative manganese-dependent inorganic pyrophosphatase [Parcubacteria group bacterium GW2011_GWE2_38_18]